LTEVKTRQSNIAEGLQDCGRQAGTVTDETTPQQVVTRLTPVAEKISRARTAIAGVVDALTRLEQQASAALEGGQPQQLRAAIRRPRELLVPATVTALDSARNAIDATIKQAQALGNG
jgi:hypothetical protein